MVLFDMPHTGDAIGQRLQAQGQVIGGPAFTAAVRGGQLEDLNPAITLRMHPAARPVKQSLGQRSIAAAIEVDQTAALQLR